MMIGGKLQNITREDVIQFARDNGIRRPDAIIRDVVASLKQFRTIATKYGVSEQWTGRVEPTIINHLKSWGEWQEEVNASELTINGHIVSNIRIEKPTKETSTSLQLLTDMNVSSSLVRTKKSSH